MMSSMTVRRWLSTALAAFLLISGVSVRSYAAQETSDNAALKEQMRAMMERIDALTAQGFGFYPWGPAGSGECRFVVSWDTPEEDVGALCAALSTL